MIERSMQDPDGTVLSVRYTDAKGDQTTRIVSPIRWVTETTFQALCLGRENVRCFKIANIEYPRLIDASDVLMPARIREVVVKAKKELKRLAEKIENKQLPEDEPLFVLRGRDKFASATVRHWVELTKRSGTPPEKISEALALASEMDKWPEKRVPGSAYTELTPAVTKNLVINLDNEMIEAMKKGDCFAQVVDGERIEIRIATPTGFGDP